MRNQAETTQTALVLIQSVNGANAPIAPSQGDHVEALGVRKREDSLKQNSPDISNDTTAPSQEDHAEALGVNPRGANQQVSNDTTSLSQIKLAG